MCVAVHETITSSIVLSVSVSVINIYFDIIKPWDLFFTTSVSTERNIHALCSTIKPFRCIFVKLLVVYILYFRINTLS